MNQSFLEYNDISKSFFGVPVLRQVSFDIRGGTILGIVGENGAGKSTLMNILGGVLEPDAGSMFIDGQPYTPRNPAGATAHGIAFIHQELNLFGNLSIAENLHIDGFPWLRLGKLRLPFIDFLSMRTETRAVLETVGLTVNPDTRVEDLSPGERQLVEIARAISMNARIVILDEPTTSLTTRETERLFELIEQLRARGIAILYISHDLEHVLRLADELLILRNGAVVASGPAASFAKERIIALMVGRDIEHLFPERDAVSTDLPVLEVRGLSQPGEVKDIDFVLHEGEILGIAGLMGSGRTELAKILFGLEPFSRGEVVITGQPFRALDPRRCIESGIAYLTEDRREEGLLMEASVTDNIALVSLAEFSHGLGLIRHGELGREVTTVSESLQLRGVQSMGQSVKTLSGGNQQKVVLAKWLIGEPRIFVLDEPTRGIDVGAKYEIYKIIAGLAARGVGVVFISSEIEELMSMCDRILVLRRGEISDCFTSESFDREAILRAALEGGEGP